MFGKVALNAIYLSSSQILARAIGFFYYIFLARALGVSNFGIYAFTLAIVYNFVPVVDFGIERFVLRDISRDSDKTGYYLARLIPLRIFLGLFSLLSVVLLGAVLGQSVAQIFYLFVFGLFLLPYSMVALLISFLNAREKMHFMSIVNVTTIFLTFLIGAVFIYLKFSFVWIFAPLLLSNLVVLWCLLIKAKTIGLPLGWKVDFSFFKKALSESWVYAVLMIVAVFYLRSSIVLMGILKGPYLTGLYSSVFKFIDAGILIPQSIALALFPISSRLFIEDKQKLKKIYFKGVALLFLLSLIPSLMVVVFSKNIISISFGQQYLSAASIFSILGIAIMLFFVNVLAGNIIQNSPKVKQFIPFSLINFLIVIALGFILIPKYSGVGAAWAVVGGEVAGLVLNNVFVLKIFKND